MLTKNHCLDLDLLSNIISTNIENEESMQLISTILDNIEAVMCAKDTQGRHFLVNSYYEQAVGVAKKDVFGKTDEEIFSFSQQTARQIMEKDQQVIRTRQKITFEEKVPDANGRTKYYLTKKSPILDSQNNALGVMCLAVNISKQKKLEQKLQRATTAKNLFLAKMSHEIRTPISAIAGYLDLINRSDPSQHKKYLSNISTSVEHLLNLVNDILDISSIEENRITLEHKRFDLLEILNSVISTLKFKANLNKITVVTKLDKQEHRYFNGDETRVKQIIFNLVSNAIKFSENAPVEIRITANNCKYADKKRIVILVKDHGIGLDTRDRDKIYQAFCQLKNSEHYFEGAGLGLAIVKEFAHLMGGTVKIFSDEGQGTIVAASLYLEESQDSASNNAKFTLYDSSESKALEGKVICIVEDQTFNREILKSMAQIEGAKTLDFEDGDHLIKAIKANRIKDKIDCFLLDIHMPILSGPETLTLLREFAEYEQTPAYFITADAVKDNLERYWSKSYKLSGIYLKPMKRHELINSVNSHHQV